MGAYTTLTGRLGADPKAITNGAAFSVAVDQWNKDSKQNQAVWFSVLCFDQLADRALAHLKKGSLVQVNGPLKVKTWQDGDGNLKEGLSIVGAGWEFVGGKKDGNGEADTSGASDSVDDDLPF